MELQAQTVWVSGQKVNRLAQFRECVGAVVFHYERCLFGPNFGMKGH